MLILPFVKISKNDAARAGGKGASLGEMTQAGIPVPPGFVILASTFERFLRSAGIHAEIDSSLHRVDVVVMHTVEAASAQIQAIILGAEMPVEIAREIVTEFKKLKCAFVAVRSSATAEDSSTAAWAGQLDSYLNTTARNLLENVKKCWASLFTPRAIFYRHEKNLHETHISVAVVVQKMVASEVSGIGFSVHPVSCDYNQLIIEAGLGLGEAIVSGQITPDSYVVEKDSLKMVTKTVAVQMKGLYRSSGGGNEWRDVAGSVQKLTDGQVVELSKLIIKIEKHYGFAVDVEWALEKGRFYIVQSRPITTLTDTKESIEKTVFDKAYTRDFSIIMQEAWFYGNQAGLKDVLKLSSPYPIPYIFYMQDGVLEVWEDRKALKWIRKSIANLYSDEKFFETVVKRYKQELELLDFFWKNIPTHPKKLKELIDLVKRMMVHFIVIYCCVA